MHICDVQVYGEHQGDVPVPCHEGYGLQLTQTSWGENIVHPIQQIQQIVGSTHLHEIQPAARGSHLRTEVCSQGKGDSAEHAGKRN
jgi:hypothetical protein